LLNYVSGKCGIINPNNPCRCPKKTRLFVEKGIVVKENLRFNMDYKQKINQLVQEHRNEISDEIQLHLQDLFRNSPFQIKNQIDNLIIDLIP
jgi:hypothetical protein